MLLQDFSNLNNQNKLKYFKSLTQNSKKIYHNWELIEPSYIDCLYVSMSFPIMKRNNFEICVEDNIFNGAMCDDNCFMTWKNCTSYLYDGYLHLGLYEDSKINITMLGIHLQYTYNEYPQYKPKFLILFQNFITK